MERLIERAGTAATAPSPKNVPLGKRTHPNSRTSQPNPAPKTRGAAIAAKCRDCVYDGAAAGTWREQVAACPITTCPLWSFRPLSGNAPDWLASRDMARLPSDWESLAHDAAIALLRSNIDASPNGCAPQAIRDISPGREGAGYPKASHAPESAHIGASEGGAP